MTFSPAAADTIKTFLNDTKTCVEDYDLIITGDLGDVGSKLLRELLEQSDWQNRPLKKMYTFLFVDCMYVTIRKEYESKNYAVYTILGYGYRRKKDILGLHSAFDPKFNQIYSKQGLQKIHSIAEKGIWSSKSCSLPKSL